MLILDFDDMNGCVVTIDLCSFRCILMHRSDITEICTDALFSRYVGKSMTVGRLVLADLVLVELRHVMQDPLSHATYVCV
jgi:hypothetical protein